MAKIKKKTKKIISRKKNQSVERAPKPEYVVINEIDQTEEKKKKKVWLIVGAFSVLLICFWFWTLKQNVGETKRGDSRPITGEDVGQKLSELKNTLTDIKASGQNTEVSDLDQIKQSVMDELTLNSESASWPSHTSKIIGVSVNFPTDWQKTENANSLSFEIKNEDEITALAGLSIEKINNPSSLSAEQWLQGNATEFAAFARDNEPIFIDGENALTLANENQDTDWKKIFILAKEKNIYEIKISTSQPEIFEKILLKIISTIKFLK